MESEFKSMAEMARELTWFSNILKKCVDYRIIDKQLQLPTLFADNLSTIEFTRSPVENRRSKHINVKLFFICEWFFEEKFNLIYVPSKFYLANPFTKRLTKYELNKFIKVLIIRGFSFFFFFTDCTLFSHEIIVSFCIG